MLGFIDRGKHSGVRRPAFYISLLVLLGLIVFNLAQAKKEGQDAMVMDARYQTAIFAGGCFWCTESDFDKVAGVIDTVSGYSGGHTRNPTYMQVSAGGSGHIEVVKVTFDPEVISYKQLLDVFWHSIDPTTNDRQFCDLGRHYRSAIFYNNEHQKMLVEQSKLELDKVKSFKEPIVTDILPAMKFYVAEDHHQNYHENNPLLYSYYRYSCGRDKRLKELWGETA